jgi:serine-type D-Ala-D-Ala carboxypeptidase (penicillin-binding protein 5/6)
VLAERISWTRCVRYLTGALSVIIVVLTVTWVASGSTYADADPAAAHHAILAAAGHEIAAAVPGVTVKGGDLVVAGTGVQLWGDDVNVRRPMGSITKVMAALVVLQAGDLDQKITVTKAAVAYAEKDEASSAGLIAGDVLTAQQLLEAMLLPSGCDAAYLLATAYGPGRNPFVAKMNAMAAQMGMTSTHFTSFDGMPFPTEYSTYSTPADLILMGEQAMRIPLFAQIVGQKQYVLTAGDGHHKYKWVQTNKLIGAYQGATGLKTGDTDAAGNCLLFEATRDGVTLIGAVLHASPTSNPGSAVVAASRVLNWGFAQPAA